MIRLPGGSVSEDDAVAVVVLPVTELGGAGPGAVVVVVAVRAVGEPVRVRVDAVRAAVRIAGHRGGEDRGRIAVRVERVADLDRPGEDARLGVVAVSGARGHEVAVPIERIQQRIGVVAVSGARGRAVPVCVLLVQGRVGVVAVRAAGGRRGREVLIAVHTVDPVAVVVVAVPDEVLCAWEVRRIRVVTVPGARGHEVAVQIEGVEAPGRRVGVVAVAARRVAVAVRVHWIEVVGAAVAVVVEEVADLVRAGEHSGVAVVAVVVGARHAVGSTRRDPVPVVVEPFVRRAVAVVVQRVAELGGAWVDRRVRIAAVSRAGQEAVRVAVRLLGGHTVAVVVPAVADLGRARPLARAVVLGVVVAVPATGGGAVAVQIPAVQGRVVVITVAHRDVVRPTDQRRVLGRLGVGGAFAPTIAVVVGPGAALVDEAVAVVVAAVERKLRRAGVGERLGIVAVGDRGGHPFPDGEAVAVGIGAVAAVAVRVDVIAVRIGRGPVDRRVVRGAVGGVRVAVQVEVADRLGAAARQQGAEHESDDRRSQQRVPPRSQSAINRAGRTKPATRGARAAAGARARTQPRTCSPSPPTL